MLATFGPTLVLGQSTREDVVLRLGMSDRVEVADMSEQRLAARRAWPPAK